jgi:hypothetical protein
MPLGRYTMSSLRLFRARLRRSERVRYVVIRWIRRQLRSVHPGAFVVVGALVTMAYLLHH